MDMNETYDGCFHHIQGEKRHPMDIHIMPMDIHVSWEKGRYRLRFRYDIKRQKSNRILDQYSEMFLLCFWDVWSVF